MFAHLPEASPSREESMATDAIQRTQETERVSLITRFLSDFHLPGSEVYTVIPIPMADDNAISMQVAWGIPHPSRVKLKGGGLQDGYHLRRHIGRTPEDAMSRYKAELAKENPTVTFWGHQMNVIKRNPDS